jgi:hypothetical protein
VNVCISPSWGWRGSKTGSTEGSTFLQSTDLFNMTLPPQQLGYSCKHIFLFWRSRRSHDSAASMFQPWSTMSLMGLEACPCSSRLPIRGWRRGRWWP